MLRICPWRALTTMASTTITGYSASSGAGGPFREFTGDLVRDSADGALGRFSRRRPRRSAPRFHPSSTRVRSQRARSGRSRRAVVSASARSPARTARHDQRLERPVTITRHFDLDAADLGQHRLRSGSVAQVLGHRCPAVLMAEMLGQLRVESGLDASGELVEQPARLTLCSFACASKRSASSF